MASFKSFATANARYYSKTFLQIQRDDLPWHHINFAALFGGFLWVAFRGNWILFWVAFAGDMIAAVNLAQVYKFSMAATQATLDGKDFLVERYEIWTNNHLLAAALALIFGRLITGWMADRLYYRQYCNWRMERSKNSGTSIRGIVLALVITALIAPLTIYRATQFVPDERSCIKLTRQIQDGESVAMKDRFDCWAISEFPTLIWLKRPPQYTYPRNDDGTRSIVVKESTAKRPVNLNT